MTMIMRDGVNLGPLNGEWDGVETGDVLVDSRPGLDTKERFGATIKVRGTFLWCVSKEGNTAYWKVLYADYHIDPSSLRSSVW